jgi:hypothetical protein
MTGKPDDLKEWLADWPRLTAALQGLGYLPPRRAKQLAYDLAEILQVCRTLPEKVRQFEALLTTAEPIDALKLFLAICDLIGEFSDHLPGHLKGASRATNKVADRLREELHQRGMDDADISRALLWRDKQGAGGGATPAPPGGGALGA